MSINPKTSLFEKLAAWEAWWAAGPKVRKSAAPPDVMEKREAVRASLILSPEDERLRSICWSLHQGYPQTSFSWNGVRTTLCLHQIVAFRAGYFPFKEIDHRNGIRHDARRENLRPASDSQQMRNQHTSSNSYGDNLIGLKRGRNGWLANLYIGTGKSRILFQTKSHKTRERAAFAYNQLAQLFGFETRNNIPIPIE